MESSPPLVTDIAGDVPINRQRLVRAHLFTWWIVAAAYVWNFIVITAM
jgi:hypothetical protein